MTENCKRLIANVSPYILVFSALSFGGWVIETIHCSLLAGYYVDRGFLHLPFCTLYGFVILATYLLLGTPQRPRGVLHRCQSPWGRYPLYFLVATAVTTGAELLTGHHAVGL